MPLPRVSLRYLAFAFRSISLRRQSLHFHTLPLRCISLPCHAIAIPSVSQLFRCSALVCSTLPSPCNAYLRHSMAAPCIQCAAWPLRFISWRYRALPLPRLFSLGNALALLWYATFCLALARLIASIRSNAVALLLETVLCSCSTSHVDALPLQGVMVRG